MRKATAHASALIHPRKPGPAKASAFRKNPAASGTRSVRYTSGRVETPASWRQAASCLLIEGREPPYADDGLFAARGTSSSDFGKNPTRRRKGSCNPPARCALLPKNDATTPGSFVAPSKQRDQRWSETVIRRET